MLHCICFTTYQYGHLNYVIIYWSTGQGNRDSQDGTTYVSFHSVSDWYDAKDMVHISIHLNLKHFLSDKKLLKLGFRFLIILSLGSPQILNLQHTIWSNMVISDKVVRLTLARLVSSLIPVHANIQLIKLKAIPSKWCHQISMVNLSHRFQAHFHTPLYDILSLVQNVWVHLSGMISNELD